MTSVMARRESFTTLDAFLETEGVRDAFQAIAIKEFLAAYRTANEGEAMSRTVWPSALEQSERD